LGAFTLNNWNDFRKIKKEEQQLFVKILSDLRSDSIIIADRLTDYQKRQQLHYQLYYEMKGQASYDSTFEYGRLGWYYNFNPIIKENYQPFVDKITNVEVRDVLKDYFRLEEGFLNQSDLFLRNQVNNVRPYLISNNIRDTDAVFSLGLYEINSPKFYKYEDIKAQFNTPEFGHILSDLRIRTSVMILMTERLKEGNSKLQMTVKQALEK
jgi:hypothetical protein